MAPPESDFVEREPLGAWLQTPSSREWRHSELVRPWLSTRDRVETVILSNATSQRQQYLTGLVRSWYKPRRMPVQPERFYVEVGRRIQGLRSSKGLTQAELGLRLDPPVTRA